MYGSPENKDDQNRDNHMQSMNGKIKRQDNSGDRIDNETIIIHGDGRFPKTVVIIENGKKREYLLKKTRKGKYLLN